MLAHFSLSHLTDPAFALAAAGLFLLYAAWRTISYFRGPAKASPDPSPEQDR